jgi:hypothetical protein
VPGFEEGLQRYCNSWWRLDQAYRRCIFHARTYQQPTLLQAAAGVAGEPVREQRAAAAHQPLERSGESAQQLELERLPRQKEFHMRYVHAPLGAKSLKRLFVVISDALRYEAARDFADRLNSSGGQGLEG